MNARKPLLAWDAFIADNDGERIYGFLAPRQRPEIIRA